MDKRDGENKETVDKERIQSTKKSKRAKITIPAPLLKKSQSSTDTSKTEEEKYSLKNDKDFCDMFYLFASIFINESLHKIYGQINLINTICELPTKIKDQLQNLPLNVGKNIVHNIVAKVLEDISVTISSAQADDTGFEIFKALTRQVSQNLPPLPFFKARITEELVKAMNDYNLANTSDNNLAHAKNISVIESIQKAFEQSRKQLVTSDLLTQPVSPSSTVEQRIKFNIKEDSDFSTMFLKFVTTFPFGNMTFKDADTLLNDTINSIPPVVKEALENMPAEKAKSIVDDIVKDNCEQLLFMSGYDDPGTSGFNLFKDVNDEETLNICPLTLFKRKIIFDLTQKFIMDESELKTTPIDSEIQFNLTHPIFYYSSETTPLQSSAATSRSLSSIPTLHISESKLIPREFIESISPKFPVGEKTYDIRNDLNFTSIFIQFTSTFPMGNLHIRHTKKLLGLAIESIQTTIRENLKNMPFKKAKGIVSKIVSGIREDLLDISTDTKAGTSGFNLFKDVNDEETLKICPMTLFNKRIVFDFEKEVLGFHPKPCQPAKSVLNCVELQIKLNAILAAELATNKIKFLSSEQESTTIRDDQNTLVKLLHLPIYSKGVLDLYIKLDQPSPLSILTYLLPEHRPTCLLSNNDTVVLFQIANYSTTVDFDHSIVTLQKAAQDILKDMNLPDSTYGVLLRQFKAHDLDAVESINILMGIHSDVYRM